MPASVAITLAPSEARTGSGQSAQVDCAGRSGLQLDLSVSDVAGVSPTLDVTLETSKDGQAWRTLGAFPRVTTSGPVSKPLAGADRYVRARWAISGAGASFTFSLSGQSLQLYVTPDDVTVYGVAGTRVRNLPPDTLAQHIIAWCATADEQLGKPYKLPLVAWPVSLRRYLGECIAWTALSSGVGVNPTTGDQDIRQRHDKALSMLVAIGANKADPSAGYVDSTPTLVDTRYTFSRPRRR